MIVVTRPSFPVRQWKQSVLGWLILGTRLIPTRGEGGTDLMHNPPDGSHPLVCLICCVCSDEVRLVGACDTLTIAASYSRGQEEEEGRWRENTRELVGRDEDITVFKSTVKFT